MPDEHGNMTPEESFNAALNQEVTPEASQAAGAAQDGTVATPTAPNAETGEQEPAAPKGNPNWEKAWENVPEPIREAQRGVFEEWDRSYDHLNARFKPYEEFEAQGIDPRYLEQAMQVMNALAEDPQNFYNTMREQFGFDQQQADAAAQGSAQALAGQEQYQSPEERRIAELQAQMAELQGGLTAQQQAQQEAYQQQQQQEYAQQVQQDLHTSLDTLAGKYGDFDREEVVRRALMNANTGRNPSIETAFFEQQAYERELLQKQARAPRVMGRGGAPGIQAPPQPAAPQNDDERYAAAMALAKSLAEG